jgi:hypothetical protein
VLTRKKQSLAERFAEQRPGAADLARRRRRVSAAGPFFARPRHEGRRVRAVLGIIAVDGPDPDFVERIDRRTSAAPKGVEGGLGDIAASKEAEFGAPIRRRYLVVGAEIEGIATRLKAWWAHQGSNLGPDD